MKQNKQLRYGGVLLFKATHRKFKIIYSSTYFTILFTGRSQ